LEAPLDSRISLCWWGKVLQILPATRKGPVDIHTKDVTCLFLEKVLFIFWMYTHTHSLTHRIITIEITDTISLWVMR
jgi:hypothetical protein